MSLLDLIPHDILLSQKHSFLTHLNLFTLISLEKVLKKSNLDQRIVSFISSLIDERKRKIPWRISVEYFCDSKTITARKSEIKVGFFTSSLYQPFEYIENIAGCVPCKTAILQGTGPDNGSNILENILSSYGKEESPLYVSYIISDDLLIPRNVVLDRINFDKRQLIKCGIKFGSTDPLVENNIDFDLYRNRSSVYFYPEHAGTVSLHTFVETQLPFSPESTNLGPRKRAYSESESSFTSLEDLDLNSVSLNSILDSSSSGYDPDDYPFLDFEEELVFSDVDIGEE